MKYVMILNDPPYGTERSYNGLARRGWTPRSRFRYQRLSLLAWAHAPPAHAGGIARLG
jgi:hypothetical protein